MKRLDFNKDWSVRKENGESRIVNLPDDAMLFEKRDVKNSSGASCAWYEGGKYTYRKRVSIPEDYEGRQIILECEGVYQNSHVLLNGEELYFRPYGYTNYYVDLTGRIRLGEENEISIIADNADTPNSRWYSGSGVYREVALHIGGRAAIAPEGIKIKSISEDTVAVEIEVIGADCFADHCEVKLDIMDDDRCVATASGLSSVIKIPNAVAWDEDNPKLYVCQASLVHNGETIDTAIERFGIRLVRWGKDGLFLNNKNVLLRGACIHHDNGVLGACDFNDAEYRRVKKLKEAGFNAIRSAHNPISKAMLSACDEIGVYVMDETFDMWFIHKNRYDYGGDTFEKWWKTDLAQMVSKDFSHPSVIMYSIGNEISDLGEARGQIMCKEMSEYIRTLDNTRAVTQGANLMLASMVAKGNGMYGKDKDKDKGSQSASDAPTSDFFNLLMSKMGFLMELGAGTKIADKIVEATSCYMDIPGYNYATMRYKKECKLYPERPFVGSETMPHYLYRNWQYVKRLPQLVGDFMWTGFDYLGEAGIGTIKYVDKTTNQPVDPGMLILADAGVIDITGFMRPEVQWNKLIWNLTDEAEIAVSPVNMAPYKISSSAWRGNDGVASWSWEGCNGYKCDVIVYTAGTSVKLLVNGKEFGTRRVKENKAVFRKVTYQPGEITAEIYDSDSRLILRKTLSSAIGKTSISLSADKTELKANGQDLCFIDINLVGENGVIKSNSDQKLTINIEGPATLQGFGSSRPYTDEVFYDNIHSTYRGHALAVVRAGYEAGHVNVTISGDDIGEVSIGIEIVAEEQI